jgi:hypothetical protein
LDPLRNRDSVRYPDEIEKSPETYVQLQIALALKRYSLKVLSGDL